jgi:NAD-dependent SIR2 family protein deacetylase
VHCANLLEADCEVEDLNLFEEDPQEIFEQAKWILPMQFLLYPNNTSNNIYFWLCA